MNINKKNNMYEHYSFIVIYVRYLIKKKSNKEIRNAKCRSYLIDRWMGMYGNDR